MDGDRYSNVRGRSVSTLGPAGTAPTESDSYTWDATEAPIMVDDHEDAADDDAHGDGHDDDGHHDADRPDYDPHKIELPSREPPLRSTAPQSDFAMTQVVRGALVLVVGLALTFGLGIVLA